MIVEDLIQVGLGINTVSNMEFMWSEPMEPKKAHQFLRGLRAITDNHTPLEAPGRVILVPDEFLASVRKYDRQFKNDPNFKFPKL